jgi:hypothetical protein
VLGKGRARKFDGPKTALVSDQRFGLDLFEQRHDAIQRLYQFGTIGFGFIEGACRSAGSRSRLLSFADGLSRGIRQAVEVAPHHAASATAASTIVAAGVGIAATGFIFSIADSRSSTDRNASLSASKPT